MTVKELSETAGLSAPACALVKDESTPSAYLDELEKQELYTDAVRFLAFKLPPDAGIKWAIACIKELRSPESQKEKDEALDASNAWIKTPGDQTRFAAKDAGGKATKGESKLLAMAVFMSGGSLAPPGAPETPPPRLKATAKSGTTPSRPWLHGQDVANYWSTAPAGGWASAGEPLISIPPTAIRRRIR